MDNFYCERDRKEYEKYLKSLGIDTNKLRTATNQSNPYKADDLQSRESSWKLVGVENRGTINTIFRRKNCDSNSGTSVTYLCGTQESLSEIEINEGLHVDIRMVNVRDCLVHPEVAEMLEKQGGGINWSTIKDELSRGVIRQRDPVFPVQWVLVVNGFLFFDKLCGFSLDEKNEELQTIIKKLKNTNNTGEQGVEHAIRWFLAAYNGYVVSIQNDCESKHRYNCIQLCKPSFINEPQEMDHILVCSAGVVVIETKHWKGKVDIRPDGKWTRKTDDESAVAGVDSPKFQMRRHEILMQQILPAVPVHSLLCFSNSSTIVDGRENFKDYPIITIDQLEETLTELCSKGTYTKEEIDGMVATIEAHKLYKA